MRRSGVHPRTFPDETARTYGRHQRRDDYSWPGHRLRYRPSVLQRVPWLEMDGWAWDSSSRCSDRVPVSLARVT